MLLYAIFMTGGFCILLFLYLHIKHDIRTLSSQLDYQNDEDAAFLNFTYGNDADIRNLRDEIIRLRKAQEEQLLKKQQLDRSFKELIANVSHDIRTPLTSISGYLQLLQDCEEEEKRQHYQQVIQARLQYLKELLEELFLYTKLQNPDFELHMERLNPCEVLSHVVLAYYQEFDKQKLKMQITYEQEQALLSCDAFVLERIFTNVVSNMIRYGSKECQIHQWIADKEMVFCFKNKTQTALKPEQVEHLFDRFYRSDNKGERSSGLGLAIVASMMEKLQGRARACYEQGELSMILTFPIRDEEGG